MPARVAANLAERLAMNSERQPNGCIFWTGTLNHYGYGVFNFRCTYYYAHRVAVELAGRVIPKGYQVNHRCRTPQCMNPEHLEVLSHADHCRVDEDLRYAGLIAKGIPKIRAKRAWNNTSGVANVHRSSAPGAINPWCGGFRHHGIIYRVGHFASKRAAAAAVRAKRRELEDAGA